MRRSVGQRARQCQDEVRTAPVTLDANVSTHRAREVAADGESQADATRGRVSRRAELYEWLEDDLLLFFRNAGAGVAHADADGLGIAAHGNPDRSTRRRILHGVADEVEHDLVEPVTVGANRDVGAAS